jgi:Protein of unknown function (DUF3224)
MTTKIATGGFEVKLAPLVFEGDIGIAHDDAKMARMSIDKRITGDLEAITHGQMLSAVTATKGSAGYVAVERVTGTLHGKSGSFVLLHTGLMNRGAPTLSVVVVADSGTEQLLGLTGEFKIIIANGGHQYEFSYDLPDN